MSRSALLVLLAGCAAAPAGSDGPLAPLHRTLDLAIGEAADAQVGGRAVRVVLLALRERVDAVNGAVRHAEVDVEVDGRRATIPSGNYHLPTAVGGVQIDCPITKGYLAKTRLDVWGLRKDARIRLWPAGSPWIEPGTFGYPARQRWFASYTHMANEPVYVDGGDTPGKKQIYYHWGLDIGGAEGLVEVVSATDGLVVSSGLDVLPEHARDTPVKKRYDVVYLLDRRGWYYRYSHLKTIEPEIRPGARVRLGQRIGLLGKEGGSGGWSHLHFDITARQPSGEWGIEEGYAFIWEAYDREHPRDLVAVARPHALAWTGETVTLDGSRSRGRGLRHAWIFGDGSTAVGPRVERAYAKAGSYAELLKVVDEAGRADYDVAVVQVCDREGKPPPTIHAAYAPTFGIRAGDPVTFKVRTFRDTEGGETWDFGDGTPPVRVTSDGNRAQHAPDGYAEAVHRYAKPGIYIATAERVNASGVKAVARLVVHVLSN